MKSIRVRWPITKTVPGKPWEVMSGYRIVGKNERCDDLQWAYGYTEEWDAKAETLLIRTTDNRFVQVAVSVVETIDATE